MASVRYFGELREITGLREEPLEAQTVRALLREIGRRHGAQALRIARGSHIIADGENAALRGGYSMKLKPDSSVDLLPVCGGG